MVISGPFVRRVGQLVILPVLGFSTVLLSAALLVSLRLEKAVGDLEEQRATLLSLQLIDAIEGGMRLGLATADQSETPGKMQSLFSNDLDVETIAVFDDAGRLLKAQDRDGVLPDFDPRIVKRVLTHRSKKSPEHFIRSWRTDSKLHIVSQARDASGTTGAVVWVVYSAKSSQVAFSTTWVRLLQASSVMILLSVLLLFVFVYLVWHRWEQHVTRTQTGIADINPIPLVPLSEALLQLQAAEEELAALELQMRALSV